MKHDVAFRCHKFYLVNLNYITEYVKSDGGYLKVHQHEVALSPDKGGILLDKLER